MIGHCSSYLGWQIQRVWWPQTQSFDNVAVQRGVTVLDFIIIRWINNEFGSDSVPIHLQRWIDSMRIQCASPHTGFKCDHNKCAFNVHWIRFLGLVWKGLYCSQPWCTIPSSSLVKLLNFSIYSICMHMHACIYYAHVLYCYHKHTKSQALTSISGWLSSIDTTWERPFSELMCSGV